MSFARKPIVRQILVVYEDGTDIFTLYKTMNIFCYIKV